MKAIYTIVIVLSLVASSVVGLSPIADDQFDSNGKVYVGYFQSWSERWADDGSKTGLGNLPSYVNAVIVSFMRPDSSYAGGTTLGGTGLDFSSDGGVVKQSIAHLKFRNPNTKVLVAVGGATYTNWQGLNENAIAQVVRDFGFDGVDIDFEPNNPSCSQSGGRVSCQSDDLYIDVVKRLRNALPRPAIVTTAGWSVGAYGEGQFASAEPQGSAYTGLAINMLRAVGQDLDWINMMSYDASPAYDPTIALQAYRSYFSGPIAMGVEIPPEAWGGHVLTIDELERLTDFVINNGGAGMMLWSLHKQGDPSAQQISDTVCPKLGLSDCGSPLFPSV